MSRPDNVVPLRRRPRPRAVSAPGPEARMILAQLRERCAALRAAQLAAVPEPPGPGPQLDPYLRAAGEPLFAACDCPCHWWQHGVSAACRCCPGHGQRWDGETASYRPWDGDDARA